MYLDFSKASDKVDHSTLLRKLSKLGTQGDVLSWVRSGVQQGSVMDPILFSFTSRPFKTIIIWTFF